MADGRTGVIVLTVRAGEALRRLLEPLCPYHDVYICEDAGGPRAPEPPLHSTTTRGPLHLPAPFRPAVIRLPPGSAEAAGFLGSVSWLPHRASSRCKALFWICHVYSGPIAHWWLLEEDVLVPTEATLLAIDARLPDADLITPHHHPWGSGRAHWSGLAPWPHWGRAAGLFPAGTRLVSSLVCGMRMSRDLAALVAAHAARNGRLCFCEMLFNTLAASAGLRVRTPPEMTATIRWRDVPAPVRVPHPGPAHPALLYHPAKDLVAQRRARERTAATPKARCFVEMWIAEGTPAAEGMRRRWAELGGGFRAECTPSEATVSGESSCSHPVPLASSFACGPEAATSFAPPTASLQSRA